MQEDFEVMLPPGNTVDDIIDGKIIVRSDENIMIQMANSPSTFLLVELLFTSSRETIVRIDFADKPPVIREVS